MEKTIREVLRKVELIAEKTGHLMDTEFPPAIEIDIILRDIRLLYEEVMELKKVQVTENISPVSSGHPSEVTHTENIKTDDTDSRIIAEEVKEQEPRQERKTKTEPSTIADKYKSEQKYINESLAKTSRKPDISSKIQSKPISNIGSALGINDRFKLINDLFNGDKESYQKTLAVLETSANFNEAFNYINSSFDWEMEDESVQILLELVRRKFIVNDNE